MKYLGIDFGLKRIGLAISEGELASPWKAVEGKNPGDLIKKISQFVMDEKFEKLVIGVPEGRTGELAKKFTKNLKSRGFDIVSVDETLSSKKALSQMIALGVPRKKRRLRDVQAAAIILQNYLDTL